MAIQTGVGYAYAPRREKRAAQQSIIDKLAEDVRQKIADGTSIGIQQAQQAAQEVSQKYAPNPPEQNTFMKGIGQRVAAAFEASKVNAPDQAPPDMSGAPADVQMAGDQVASRDAAAAAMAGAPADVQIAGDTQGRMKVPGVPAGVAEAFPDTVDAGPVYHSGAQGPSNNVVNPLHTGSLLDNQNGLPDSVKHVLNTPVVGDAAREAARPSNWLAFAAGPAVQAVAKTLPVVGGVAGVLTTPFGGGAAQRIAEGVAAEVGGKYGSEGASALASKVGAPGPVQAVAPYVGGLVGGGVGIAGVAGAKAGVEHALASEGGAAAPAAKSFLESVGSRVADNLPPEITPSSVEHALAGTGISGGAPEGPMLDPYHPGSATQRLFNIKPPESVLTNTDRALNSLNDVIRGPNNANTRNEIATPITREHAAISRKVDSQAARLASVAADTVKVFARDEQGRITDLPGQPTIQDVAAKLPEYWGHLSAEQRTAMQQLSSEVRPWSDAFLENGGQLGSRPDVVEGGFYLPRGTAGPEGMDAPIKVGSGRGGGGKGGFQKTATFDSMTQGIDAGYQYSPFEETIQSYGRDVGNKALEKWTANTFEATGLGESTADRIDPSFRAKVETLRRQTASTATTLRNQNARASTIATNSDAAQRTSAQTESLAMKAGQRLADLKARVEEIKNPRPVAPDEAGQPLPEGYDFQQLISSLPDRQTLVDESARLREQLTRSKVNGEILNNKANNALAAKIGQTDALHEIHYALERANGDAAGALDYLYQEQQKVGLGLEARQSPGLRATLKNERPGASRRANMSDAANATSLYNRAAGATEDDYKIATAYSKSLDDLTGGQPVDVYSNLDTPPVTPNMPTEEAIASAQREFNVMDREARKQLNAAERTGNQAEAARIRNEITGQRYDDLRTQLRDILPAWKAHQLKAAQMPRDAGQLGGLPSLTGTSFPDAVANAWNKYYNDTQPLSGKGSSLPLAIKAFNNFQRGLRATGDISYTGIQGLLGAVTYPKEYLTAMGQSFRAMGDETAVGAHLRQFDAAAAADKMPDSKTWAAGGLHIGGPESEFTVGQGLGDRISHAVQNAPVVKQANVAFGAFGDVLRLEAANAMARAAKASGKELTPEYIAQIAHASNLITGYSEHKLGGSLGELGLFAPRFFASQLELVGSFFARGPVGDEARQALIKLIGVGTLATVAANQARGKPTDFNPTSSNFMRIRDVGGTDISLFGPWDSLVKGIAATAKGDPSYILRSKASPTVSIAWDLLSGQSFLGQNTRTPEYLLRNLLPFSAAQIGQESPLKTAIGLTGVKASDLSPTERLDQVGLDSPAHKRFNDMTLEERGNLLDAHPDLAQARLGAQQGKTLQYQQQKAQAATKRQALDDALLSGSLDRTEWKKQSDNINTELRGAAGVIFGADKQAPDAAAQARDPAMHWLAIQHEFTNPTTGVVDQLRFQQALAQRMTPADVAAAYRGFGANDTPLQKLKTQLSDQYYAIPKYRGFSADDGQSIDQAWALVLGKVGSSASSARMFRAIGQLGITDPQVKRALFTRASGGTLSTNAARARWAKANPAARPLLGLGTGPANAAEQAALAKALHGA